MVTIFANFRINDEQRFKNLKRSFFSFYKANINNWIINIRGTKKKEVREFLEKNIIQNFEISHLDSPEGWFYDTQKLTKQGLSDYIFTWNEDHINMVNEEKFNHYIKYIIENNIDQFTYSWFHLGDMFKSFQISNHKKKDIISYIDLNYHSHRERLKLIKDKGYFTQEFIISLQGIFKKDFFLKIINTDDPFLKRWNKNTPFDFEKIERDIHWLPFRYACPNEEFFACLDDDAGHKGYCLNHRNKIVTKNESFIYSKIKNKNIFRIILLIIRFPLSHICIQVREIVNRLYSIYKYLKKIQKF